ncbi:MAG: DUF488 family protein [Cyanobacteria bacterium REEB65]|nr:DUF488 family protein [Cyanobacteria bacterium REEB65]
MPSAIDIRLKRAYEPPGAADGTRILVDRVWPRGVSKADLALAGWRRETAPSTELRQWFGHQPERWEEFRRRYREELAANVQALEPLLAAARQGPLTLVYGAKDREHNQAVVLREMLLELLARGRG